MPDNSQLYEPYLVWQDRYMNPYDGSFVFQQPMRYDNRPMANPYPVLPPPVAHKVWILNCRTCNTFLTNRGMKAVLLLRPNVPLFSTDALPVNCSTWSCDSDAFQPSGSSQRTCECLTQSLCCHGCGTTIGYSIVSPCSRCISSVSPTNGATNGHRFVFHSNEIIGTERHYIPGEAGVNPIEMPPNHPQWDAQHAASYHYSHYQIHSYSPIPPPLEPADILSRHPAPTTTTSNSSLMPPAASVSEPVISNRWPNFAQAAEQLSSRQNSPFSSPSPRRSVFYHPPPHLDADSDQKPIDGNSDSSPSTTRCRRLKAGDELYWHHLTSSGEIPQVTEDARARGNNDSCIDDRFCR